MPIPWLAVIQSVPWTEVVKNAPRIVEGAKKLFGATSLPAEKPDTRPGSRGIELEGAIVELQAQMADSSDLIKALAEQNTQLIQRVDILHRHIRRLGIGLLVVVLALTSMAWVLFR